MKEPSMPIRPDSKRVGTVLLALSLLASGTALAAEAVGYPVRSIRMIVALAAAASPVSAVSESASESAT